jgi:hypothetical protein
MIHTNFSPSVQNWTMLEFIPTDKTYGTIRQIILAKGSDAQHSG